MTTQAPDGCWENRTEGANADMTASLGIKSHGPASSGMGPGCVKILRGKNSP
jgi:hypothetical protein